LSQKAFCMRLSAVPSELPGNTLLDSGVSPVRQPPLEHASASNETLAKVLRNKYDSLCLLCL
jgi:hypothetical protein